MMMVLLGKKIGSTKLLQGDDGVAMHVTVLQVEPSKIAYTKTKSKDGYDALVLSSGSRKPNKINYPEKGIAKKYGIGTYKNLYEIKVDSSTDLDIANESDDKKIIDINQFSLDEVVDIRATSKGKGFAGTIKRWNFAGQDRSHGNSLSHRVPGSIGGNQPGRVWKHKKMSGHMGHESVTIKGAKLVKIDAEKGLAFIKGPIPGCNGGEITIKQKRVSS